MSTPPSSIGRRLEGAPPAVFALYSVCASFGTYFCMYAFRKPFAAANFPGEFGLLGIDLKTGLVITQIIGYALSKFLGIKFCSEITPGRRAGALVALVLFAEAALVAVGFAPGSWKALGLFFNGLALGMVWGLVVWYLEGRRTSEVLLAGLSCSFIVASGIVKDVGRFLLSSGVPEGWMPAATGLCFLPLYLLSVWLLKQIPPPSAADVAERVGRVPMESAARWDFVRRFFLGLVILLVLYLFLMAYRDFRDNYAIEIFQALGYGETPALFTKSEVPIAFAVLAVMACLSLVKDNDRGLLAAMAIMGSGTALLGVATVLHASGAIDGFTWMVLLGVGTYLAYVPFNSVLFDRMIASTGTVGTAVFAIYLADALGYTGSVGVQLYRDLGPGGTRLGFFTAFTWFLSIGGTACVLAVASYFWWRGRSVQLERAGLEPLRSR